MEFLIYAGHSSSAFSIEAGNGEGVSGPLQAWTRKSLVCRFAA